MDSVQRKLVVLLDGTGNRYSQQPTNILRLQRCLPKNSGKVLTYYDQGVGTFGLRETLFEWQSIPARIFGLAFGWGLRRVVSGAYRFLAENYRPGDQLYLFGFSRGAYAARALAALSHAMGLVEAHNTHLFDYAWEILKARDRKGRVDFALQASFQKHFGRRVPIRFLGLFDTVKSVGWIYDPLSLPYTRDNRSVKSIRHAVSLDEQRSFFRQNLWDPSAKDLSEVWFSGVHSDVGGGYAEDESQLALISLRWMLSEALANGLDLEADSVRRIMGGGRGRATPDPGAEMHDSMTSAWKIAEWVPRLVWSSKRSRMVLVTGAMPPFGTPRQRMLPQDARLHWSVESRLARPGYRGSRLPDDPLTWVQDHPDLERLIAG